MTNKHTRKDAATMKPERNGTCAVCDGRIRYYPPGLASGDPYANTSWAHLNRADWIDNPHSPQPTPQSLEAAGLTS
jgi:hypothetical protein